MSAGDLAKFEPQRRYATLAALAIESEATVTDEVIELHDRILWKVFNQAKNRHRDAFHDAGREINDKVLLFSRVGELLLMAREKGSDPFAAIDEAIGWEAFQRSVTEARALAQGKDFDSLPQIRDSYAMLRRYTPDLLDTLHSVQRQPLQTSSKPSTWCASSTGQAPGRSPRTRRGPSSGHVGHGSCWERTATSTGRL